MHILVIGAAGMVGRKLVERLAADGRLGGREITRATLHDVVEPQAPAAPFQVKLLSSDFSEPGEAEKLVAERPDVIFHLAAIVSGEAEADFDKGYRINLDGTRMLFDAIRKIGSAGMPALHTECRECFAAQALGRVRNALTWTGSAAGHSSNDAGSGRP